MRLNKPFSARVVRASRMSVGGIRRPQMTTEPPEAPENGRGDGAGLQDEDGAERDEDGEEGLAK